MGMDTNSSTITILLTSAVIASLVTSIANIIIAIFNNHRLKSIEKEKRMNELTIYRYTRLFEMLLKWKDFETPFEIKDKNPSQITVDRAFNSFFDSRRRFEIISPLIDESYKKNIYNLNQEGEQLLNELFKIEFALEKESTAELKAEHTNLFKAFIDIATKYTIEIEKVVHLQLEQLLRKSNT